MTTTLGQDGVLWTILNANSIMATIVMRNQGLPFRKWHVCGHHHVSINQHIEQETFTQT